MSTEHRVRTARLKLGTVGFRLGVLLCASGSMGACKRDAPGTPDTAPAKVAVTQTPPPSKPAASPARAPADEGKAPTLGAKGRVVAEVTKRTAAVLVAPERAWAAELKREGVERARKLALRRDGRIAGHRLAGALRVLPVARSAELGKLALDDHNYLFDRERRCANSSWLGARYQTKEALVEIALGAPCDQLLVFWRSAVGVEVWGGWVVPQAARSMRAVLKAKK